MSATPITCLLAVPAVVATIRCVALIAVASLGILIHALVTFLPELS